MTEEMKIKWSEKLGYASANSGLTISSLFITNFMLIYLTDAIGMDPAIVGSLMLVARIFDGISDVVVAGLIDRTHTRWGKTKPWIFWCALGNVVTFAALFAIPTSIGSNVQYIYFFLFYMLNTTIFHTGAQLAHTALMPLITRDNKQRVQLSAIGSVCANIVMIIISSFTLGIVARLGGGAQAWRILTFGSAILSMLLTIITLLTCKEHVNLEEDIADESHPDVKKENPVKVLAAIFTCKYFLAMLGNAILGVFSSTLMWSVASYFAIYVLKSDAFMGQLSVVNYGCAIIFTLLGSVAVSKWGMYKANMILVPIGLLGRLLCVIGGGNSVSLILFGIVLYGVSSGVMGCTTSPFIASICEYIRLSKNINVNAMGFACLTVGIKIGSGVGTAICGFLLSKGGYIANAAEQTPSAITMITAMFALLPLIASVLQYGCVLMLKVTQEVDKLRAQKAEQ